MNKLEIAVKALKLETHRVRYAESLKFVTVQVVKAVTHRGL